MVIWAPTFVGVTEVCGDRDRLSFMEFRIVICDGEYFNQVEDHGTEAKKQQ